DRLSAARRAPRARRGVGGPHRHGRRSPPPLLLPLGRGDGPLHTDRRTRAAAGRRAHAACGRHAHRRAPARGRSRVTRSAIFRFLPFPIFPEQASTLAGRIDHLLFFLLGLSALMTATIAALILWFSIRYRR